MITLKEKIQVLAQQVTPQVIAYRRHLHQHPELSYEEYQTAAFVANELQKLGIKHTTGVANTGVVALVEGKNPHKKTFALRADMDALPIVEANDVPYKSKYEGKMHACGHDAHTASLLGVAHILQQLKNEFEGTVKLIFQPAEEQLPGGASMMIKEGVLQNPTPQGIVGQHVMPFIDAGKVGFRSGMYMASADEITFFVRAKGGHAAMPHLTADTVLVAAHIIVALQQIVSRMANPLVPSVLSFCALKGGNAYNVLPAEVIVKGTFRTMDEAWRTQAHEKMKKMAETLAESMGATCQFVIDKGYPVLINDEKLTAQARSAAEEYLGSENVLDLDKWMAAEDFAYYSHEIQACFYRLGTRNTARNIISGVHTPTFDIEESALEIGAGLMAYIALNNLAQ
jgi:amidohydrolase